MRFTLERSAFNVLHECLNLLNKISKFRSEKRRKTEGEEGGLIDLLNEANELLLRVSISKLFQSLTVAGKKDESNVARRVDGVIKSF